MSQPESKLSRAILAALRNRGIYAIKIHGGPMMQAGTPDILACVPVECHPIDDPGTFTGVFIGFETKMPDGGNPTPIQEFRHFEIRRARGVVVVPRSVQDALDAIYALGYRDAPPTP